MNEKLTEIFQRMFKIDAVSNSTSPENLEDWDSYAHIELILEIESEFGITISTAEAVELNSFEKISTYLTEKGAS